MYGVCMCGLIGNAAATATAAETIGTGGSRCACGLHMCKNVYVHLYVLCVSTCSSSGRGGAFVSGQPSVMCYEL